PDPQDGRLRRVFLTGTGTQQVETIRENVEAVELGILNRIPAADLDHAAETLVALKATLLAMVEADEAGDDRADINKLD
ncbi:MAG: hypothetical protein RL367_1444, partial [Pseudomonadota bacterium]